MPEDTPINKVHELQNSGKSNTEIIQSLQGEGYSFQQISEALNQTQQGMPVATQESPSEMKPSVLYSEEPKPTTPIQEPSIPEPTMIAEPQMAPAQQSYQPQAWPKKKTFNYQTSSLGATTEDIEEIAESIVHEKWQKLTEEFGDLLSWKDKVTNDIDSIKQELMRVENRFENLQGSVIGKVKEYDESVSDVGVEIKALGKLLSNIINPLTSNVKELEKILKDLKK
jgi:hypothetical protein